MLLRENSIISMFFFTPISKDKVHYWSTSITAIEKIKTKQEQKESLDLFSSVLMAIALLGKGKKNQM